jgi:hypothetical protein
MQGQSVRLLRPLPGGPALAKGSKTLTALEAGTYTYTLTTTSGAGSSTCSTTLRVTGTATPPEVPKVIDRIGLAASFNVSAQDPSAPKYDLLWTFGVPTSTSRPMGGFYVPHNREPLGVPGEPPRFGAEEHHPVAWYRANHPDWLVYKNDRATLAASFEYRTAAGQPYHLPPIDITNPAVREYIWDRRIAPALLEGYRLISFDNGGPFNTELRAGVKPTPGGWRQLFRGTTTTDPAYVRAVRDWLDSMRRRIHAAGARAGMNMDYGKGYEAEFLSVAGAADIVMNEGSFVNQRCAKDDFHYQDDVPGRPDPDVWTARFTMFRQIARERGLVLAHPCTGQAQPAVVSWAIANYLLVRGERTFLVLQQGATWETTRSLVVERPEFAVPIGAPAGEPTRIPGTKLWSRAYTNGLVLVNPSATTAHSTTLPAGAYRDLEGAVKQGRIAVPPTTGLVLVAAR